LGTAAAELFRRCERLQIELRGQIRRANEVASRVEAVTGDDIDDGLVTGGNEGIEKRIREARDKQKNLVERLEKMRKRVMKGSSRELSDKEKIWMEEIMVLKSNVIGGEEEEKDTTLLKRRMKESWKRYEEVKKLEELVEKAKEAVVEEETVASPSVKIPSEIRKAKIAQVMSLLERESALVEGAKSRLERLSLS